MQSPCWAANWFAASQEIPRISRNPKVHYRTHKRPPPASILGQPNPGHIPTPYLLEIQPNIIHPSTPRSPQWSMNLQIEKIILLPVVTWDEIINFWKVVYINGGAAVSVWWNWRLGLCKPRLSRIVIFCVRMALHLWKNSFKCLDWVKWVFYVS